MTRTWSEGVCGDGAAILCDGELVPISELIVHLNRCEFIRSAALEEAAKVADAEMLAARNMDAVHVSASARGIAHAIRALKDKPHE